MTYQVETQCWKHWPKVLIMRNDDGETRRYLPERRAHTMSCSAYDGVSFYLHDFTVCSECGGRLTDNRLEHVRYRYCPWCGAKLVVQ